MKNKKKENPAIKRDEKGEIIIGQDDICYKADELENDIDPIFNITYGEYIPEGKIISKFTF